MAPRISAYEQIIRKAEDDRNKSPADLLIELFRDVDARVSVSEQIAAGAAEFQEALRQSGELQVQAALNPVLELIRAKADLGAILTAASASPVSIGDGTRSLVIPESTRAAFAPAHTLSIVAADDPTVALFAERISYSPLTGALEVDVHTFTGTPGVIVSSWVIAPASFAPWAAAIKALPETGVAGPTVQAAIAQIAAAIAAFLARSINTSGLAGGGGNLSVDRTIDVPIASQAENEAGAINNKSSTPLGVSQRIAILRGAANGLASLDAGGKLATAQIPAALVGALQYQAAWNASTNTPAIPAAAAGNKGHYYKVSVAGATNIDGINDWKVGDWIISNGATWDKIDNTDQVTSVAGKGGAVTLVKADVALPKVDDVASGGLGGFRNKLINGDGRINQRAIASATDDTYAWDRHIALTQTGAVGISSITDVSDDLPSMMRMTQSQAAAQRMGFLQIVESIHAKPLRGKLVTLGGALRCSAAQPIRFALLEWRGGVDAPTSDVVNDWANGNFATGQFFNVADLVVVGTGAVNPAANTITPFALATTVGISTTVRNLMVFLWTEGTAAQNVTLDLSWYLVEGDVSGSAQPFARRSAQDEESLCQRYLEVIPTMHYMLKLRESDRTRRVAVLFKAKKRAIPAVTSTYAADGAGSLSTNPDVHGVSFEATAAADGNAPRMTDIVANAEL